MDFTAGQDFFTHLSWFDFKTENLLEKKTWPPANRTWLELSVEEKTSDFEC